MGGENHERESRKAITQRVWPEQPLPQVALTPNQCPGEGYDKGTGYGKGFQRDCRLPSRGETHHEARESQSAEDDARRAYVAPHLGHGVFTQNGEGAAGTEKQKGLCDGEDVAEGEDHHAYGPYTPHHGDDFPTEPVDKPKDDR